MIDAQNPLPGLEWDYTGKLSYRRFCCDMSSRFHCLSTEERLADSTAGSLALSLAFLCPWFHQTADVDYDRAIRTLKNLASIIAQWPGQWWVREHPEIYNLTHAMAVTLCQELCKRHKYQDKEVSRLQGVVNKLCNVVKEYEVIFNSIDEPSNSNQPEKTKPIIFIDPAAPIFSPPMCDSASPPARIGSTCARVQTPLTPPDTPKSSSFPSSPSTTIGCVTETQAGTIDLSLESTVESKGIPSRGILNAPLSTVATFSINPLANQPIPPSRTNLIDLPSPTSLSIPSLGSIALAPSLARLGDSFVSPESHPQENPLPPSPFQDSPIAPGHWSRNVSSSATNDEDGDTWTMISQVGDLHSDGDDRMQADEDSSYRKKTESSAAKTEVASASSATFVVVPLSIAADSCSGEGPEYPLPRPISGISPRSFELVYTQVNFIRRAALRQRRVFETVGRFAAGFLIGAFITAAIFNSQRRMIVHLT